MGQCEAIFKQYIFPKKVWKYNRDRCLVPKDEGCSVMMSGLKSREFGYIYPPMTSEQINTVNNFCRNNNQYTDTIEATNILNSVNNQPITPQESPFNSW